MGKLLFTEDELHRSFKFFEEEERPKAEAVKQYKYNESALKWLRTVYHEKAERKLTTEEVLSHPVTIADAFRWYSSYRRKQFSENQTVEARDILREAQRGESVCEMISYKPQELKAILWDYALIQVAEKALKCWNDVLPFKTVQDQQQAAAPAADQEPKTPGRKEKLSMDVFMREIFPDMKLRFPDSKHVAGKKAYCETVGKAHGVSEKTIRDKFDTCNNDWGETI